MSETTYQGQCPVEAAIAVAERTIKANPELYKDDDHRNQTIGGLVLQQGILESLREKLGCTGSVVDRDGHLSCSLTKALNDAFAFVSGPTDAVMTKLAFANVDTEEPPGQYI